MKTWKPKGARVPVKAWVDGVPLDDGAREQLENVSRLPFVHHHVAAMPDAHWGMGATVGSVIPTTGAIVPAAVGVDIGCGMQAKRTSLTSHQLPENLEGLRAAIEGRVPVGFSSHGDLAPNQAYRAWRDLSLRYEETIYPFVKTGKTHPLRQIGTLGGGNHFIEVCLDEEDSVWIVIHSGSRGVGNRTGRHFIKRAKVECDRWGVGLPDKDLSFLPEGTPGFDEYVAAVAWCQDYARKNREVIMYSVSRAVAEQLANFLTFEEAIDCHHNYVERENHFGKNVWVTRKGAVRAREGDLGIIPGSMGARSFIVRGKGNPESFHSCSHGAGRVMSRREAKESFTVEDHALATAGVECRKDAGVLDETPGAYKDIDAVMAAQEDLVEVVHELRQVVCVKG